MPQSTWGNSSDSQAVAPQPLVLMSRHLKDLMHNGEEVGLCWWERRVGKNKTPQIASALTCSVTTWGLETKEYILWWWNKHGQKVSVNPWKRGKNFKDTASGPLVGPRTGYLSLLAWLLLTSHWCFVPCDGFSASFLPIPPSSPPCIVGIPSCLTRFSLIKGLQDNSMEQRTNQPNS